jgi:S1-C subfamily serine protease
VLNDFKEFGSVRRGYIGIQFTGLDAEQSKRLGVDEINGLYVNEVLADGGAAQAGIKEGDIITKVDGNQIISPSDLQERIGRLGPGDKVQLSYLRNGKTLTSDVTLKGEESVKAASNSTSVVTKNLGASFVPASEAIKKKYKISSGVLVTSVKAGGFFDQLDLVQGTIITTINGRPINKTDDIESAITAGRNNMATVNAISPDGMQIRYQFQVR